jgi:RES domain-containing protein
MRVWRIIKNRYATDAFTGEGSRLNGSRWTSPGGRVIHASQSLSLATLEVLVHLQASKPLAAYVVYDIEFPDACVLAIDVDSLPDNWRDYPAPPETRSRGDAWLRNASSAVLRVPSAIVPIESNFLLNPEHSDFSGFPVRGPRPLDVDRRVFRRVE